MDYAIKGRDGALAACALAFGLFAASWPAQAGGKIFDLDFGKREAQTLTVGDSTAIYLDKGSGPPIVLFHPTDDYRNWQRQIPEFAKTHRVIALSYRIDETAPPPSDMSDPSGLAAMLEALETQLDLGPVNLVAHSVGGLQAMRVAAERPELLRRLVLVEPAADLSTSTLHCALSDPSEFELGICNFESRVAGPGYYEGASEGFGQYLQELQRAQAKAAAATPDTGAAPPHVPDVCSEIGKITMPVLFIRGANTPAAFQVGLDHHEECLPPHERVVLPHATHWGHLDDAEGFNHAVLDFVERD